MLFIILLTIWTFLGWIAAGYCYQKWQNSKNHLVAADARIFALKSTLNNLYGRADGKA